MKNPVSSTSVQNRPTPVETPSQNTGSLNGRRIKALLYSAMDRYGLATIFLCIITGIALPQLHELKCKDQCPLNFFSFSVAGLSPNLCTLIRVSNLFVLTPFVTLPCIRHIQFYDLLKEIRNDLKNPLTEELKDELTLKIKKALFINTTRLTIYFHESNRFVVKSSDGTQAVMFRPSGEISFHSWPGNSRGARSLDFSFPPPTEPLAQNTGWLLTMPIRVILSSALDYPGLATTLCLYTAFIAFASSMETCPQFYQNTNETSCPVLSKRSFTCDASFYTSFIAIFAAIAFATIVIGRLLGKTRHLSN